MIGGLGLDLGALLLLDLLAQRLVLAFSVVVVGDAVPRVARSAWTITSAAVSNGSSTTANAGADPVDDAVAAQIEREQQQRGQDEQHERRGGGSTRDAAIGAGRVV